MQRLSGAWESLLNFVSVHPVAGLSAVFAAGIVFWGGFNWSLEVTNIESFCISCHAMKVNVYEEYRKSTHHDNRTGVRASCPDCHVPKEWVHKVVRKVQATNELFHWMAGSIDTPAKFDARRPELARQVWASMKATDSRECRNCHGIGFMTYEVQTAEARAMHVLAEGWGKTCIDCHKGIAHTLPNDFDEDVLLNELHERMESEKIDCRQCHVGMAGAPAGEAW